MDPYGKKQLTYKKPEAIVCLNRLIKLITCRCFQPKEICRKIVYALSIPGYIFNNQLMRTEGQELLPPELKTTYK